MKFLIPPKQDSWVAVQDHVTADSLRARIRSSQICISDLDDTIAPSPAKRLAYQRLFSPKAFHPKFIGWSFQTAAKLLTATSRSQAEETAFLRYVQLFLRDEKELERIQRQFTPDYAQSTIFPGVAEFYRALPAGIETVDITKNIAVIAQAYQQVLGLKRLYCEVQSKPDQINNLLLEHPERRRVIIFDDCYGAGEAEQVLDSLTTFKKAGMLEDVVSCLVTNSPEKINERFTINIPPDYRGLVSVLRNN